MIWVVVGVGLVLWLVWREEVTEGCFGGYVVGVAASSECQVLLVVVDEVGNKRVIWKRFKHRRNNSVDSTYREIKSKSSILH